MQRKVQHQLSKRSVGYAFDSVQILINLICSLVNSFARKSSSKLATLKHSPISAEISAPTHDTEKFAIDEIFFFDKMS